MTLIENFREWRDRRRQAADAAHMAEADIAGLGLSPADFRDIAAMTPARIARMEIMAGLHGVSPDRLDGDAMTRLDVALTCARCGHVRDCTRELTSAEGTTAARCSFCPNVETFNALAEGA